jgi:hypothetical protein
MKESEMDTGVSSLHENLTSMGKGWCYITVGLATPAP